MTSLLLLFPVSSEVQYYCGIDYLCNINNGRGFRHLEIVQAYPNAIDSTIPDPVVIDYLSKVSMPLGLETLTIIVSKSADSESWYPPTLNQQPEILVIPELRATKKALCQTLDTPFYANLRRVVWDFRDLSWNHPHIFRHMKEWMYLEEGAGAFYGVNTSFKFILRF